VFAGAEERADLVEKLSKYGKKLEQSVALSDLRKRSHLRRCLRHTGDEIREVDRVLRGVDSRFAPDSGTTLRRASQPFRDELNQPFRRGPLDKQWNEITNGSALESAVFLMHNPGDLVGLEVRVDAGQSLRQTLDDLLFTQLDHGHRLRDLDGFVKLAQLSDLVNCSGPRSGLQGRHTSVSPPCSKAERPKAFHAEGPACAVGLVVAADVGVCVIGVGVDCSRINQDATVVVAPC
jgi:hypothetical protein